MRVRLAALSCAISLHFVLGAPPARAEGALNSSRDKKTSPAGEWRKIKDSTGREYACWSPALAYGRRLKEALGDEPSGRIECLHWVQDREAPSPACSPHLTSQVYDAVAYAFLKDGRVFLDTGAPGRAPTVKTDAPLPTRAGLVYVAGPLVLQ